MRFIISLFWTVRFSLPSLQARMIENSRDLVDVCGKNSSTPIPHLRSRMSKPERPWKRARCPRASKGAGPGIVSRGGRLGNLPLLDPGSLVALCVSLSHFQIYRQARITWAVTTRVGSTQLSYRAEPPGRRPTLFNGRYRIQSGLVQSRFVADFVRIVGTERLDWTV